MLTFEGPGLDHSLQTGHDCTMLEMFAMVTSETPTFSRNLFMVRLDACHHLMCNFRSTRRTALSLSVLNTRMDFPTLKSNQLFGLGEPTAVSVQVRRTLCSRSGPRTVRGKPASATEASPVAGSVPVDTVVGGPGPLPPGPASPVGVPLALAALVSPVGVPPGRAPSTPTEVPSARRWSPDAELADPPKLRCLASC